MPARYTRMAAARISTDVLEMFYGPISQEENRRQKRPIEPTRIARDRYIDFNLERNNFNRWLRSWKINFPWDYPSRGDLLQFAGNTKTRFTNLTENEIASLGSIKTKFALLAKFSTFRNEQTQYMEHYFAQRLGTTRFLTEIMRDDKHRILSFCRRIKRSNWSLVSKGVWLGVVAAYGNVTRSRYEPFRGGSYMPLPKKLQAKKAIINVQKEDNQCLRWAIRTALFPPPQGVNVSFERFSEENLPTNSEAFYSNLNGKHSRPQRPRSFWSRSP